MGTPIYGNPQKAFFQLGTSSQEPDLPVSNMPVSSHPNF